MREICTTGGQHKGNLYYRQVKTSQGSTEIRGGQRKSRGRSGRLARDYREGRMREICTTGGQHKGNLCYRQVKDLRKSEEVRGNQGDVSGGWLVTIERAA